jgi:cell division protein FtsB
MSNSQKAAQVHRLPQSARDSGPDTGPQTALEEQNAQLRRYAEELRALLPALRAEAEALRKENAWLKRWVKELREGLAALTARDAA